MRIISVRDNGNNRWKRNAKKKKKQRKKQGSTKAIMKRWELIDFVMYLTQVFSN